MAAARACFVAAGTTDVSMEDVAAAAGVVRSTLYVYFPAREALLSAAVQSMYAEFEAELASGTRFLDQPMDELARVLTALIAVVDRDPVFFRLLLGLESERSAAGIAVGEELATIGLAIGGTMEHLLVRAIELGELGPHDVRAGGVLLGQQLYGALATRGVGAVDWSPAETAERIVAFCQRGLA